MNEHSIDKSAMTAVWQSQNHAQLEIPAVYVRHLSEKLHAAAQREILVAFVTNGICAILVVVTGLMWMLGYAKGFLMGVSFLAAVCLFIGSVFLATQVRRRATTEKREQGEPAPCLMAYRAELKKQCDYYRNSWRWSIWPSMIPAVLLIVGLALSDRPGKIMNIVIVGGLFSLGSALGWIDSARKAKKIETEMTALVAIEDK